MAPPQYLIAKYIPDLSRMEPRNVGIILWADGRIQARFIGEASGRPLKDCAPSFINAKSRDVYAQWVRHFRRALAKDCISPRGSDPVPKSSPEFLDALRSKSRGNYLLVSAGVLLDRVSAEDMDDTVDFLFEKLVGDQHQDPKDQEHRILRRSWKKVVSTAGLRRRSDFKERYNLRCSIEGVSRDLKFDNAIANGKPTAVFQHALLHRDESVNNAYVMLASVTRQQILPKDRCACIIYATDVSLASDVYSAIEMLRLHSTIINVGSEDDALDTLDSMSLPPAGDH